MSDTAQRIGSDRLVAGGPEQTSRVWPAWQVPAKAVLEWVVLALALERMGRQPACAAQPEVWWSTRKSPAEAALQAEAVEACSWCPVVEECRAYALAAGERAGVWGGTTPAERRVLSGRRR